MNNTKDKTERPQTLRDYVLSIGAYWFWTVIILAAATIITVFTVPEDSYPRAHND